MTKGKRQETHKKVKLKIKSTQLIKTKLINCKGL